ncbi:MAG: hypothetical protein AAGC45_02725 [Bacteroidota bacterium]
MRKIFEKLKSAESEYEIDKILNEIVLDIRANDISPAEVLRFFKTGGSEFVPKSQDHQMTHSNSGKAEEILRRLMDKLNQ